jgi:hypothetical protein
LLFAFNCQENFNHTYTEYKKEYSFFVGRLDGGLKMLEQEILVDTLRDKYSEEVTEIIENCQFIGKNYLDVDTLNLNLKSLRILNFHDSLSEDDWFELLYELTPDIYDELSLGKLAA